MPLNTTKVHYEPAAAVTGKAKTVIKAGTFVAIAGDLDRRNPVIGTAAAGAVPFGVPAHDAEIGEYVTVYRYGSILQLNASGTIAAGDPVAVGASGTAVKAVDAAAVAGVAVSTAKGKTVIVALNR